MAAQLFSQVSINGYLETYNRVRLYDESRFTWNENILGLKFEGAPSDGVHYFSEVRLRGFGFPTVSNMSDLQRQEKDLVQPWGLEFREAYIDIYGFLSDNLDLRIGRQRIVWGTADMLNPTDNLNPDDLEDIFDFGRHLGSNAVKASYYLGDIAVTGVFIPIFTPATMPYGDWAEAFSTPLTIPAGMTIGQYEDHIILPENKLSETSSFGFKVATTLFSYDVSLSYYKGRDDLPLLSSVSLTPMDTLGTFAAKAEMIYPPMRVIGADIAGSIGDIGIWAEGALFMPEKQYSYVSFPNPQLGTMVTQEEIALDDKPYLKYIIGGDYTFKNGWYVNGQYLHGFIHERGQDNLNDYFFIRLEKKFMHDALRFVPFGGALTITDWNDIKNNYGFTGGPEIDYYPFDGLEISLGAFFIDGKGANLFGQLKNKDEAFLKVRYSF